MPALDVDALKRRVGALRQSFTAGQLAIVAMLGVVAIVGGMAFMKWASAPSYAVLFSDLDAKDASEITKKLDADGVAYKLGDGGTSVLVPSAKVHETRVAVSAAGLPKTGSAGYDLLDKEGLTTSEFRQQVNYQRALEGELSRTLLAVAGVENATVHLAIPKDRLFEEDRQPTRASVLLKTDGTIGDDAVQTVVHLVASAVPGLTPDQVTVGDTEGRVLSAQGVSGASTNRQLKQTQAYEAQLAAKASSMLTQVLGAGKAVVRVSADLDFNESQRETETFDNTNPAILRETGSTETFTGQGSPPNGAAGGTVAIDPVTGDSASGAAGTNDYSKTDTAREFGVNRTIEKSTVAPGAVRRLSVAVVLDGSGKNLPATANVERIVSAAVGLDTERGDTIAVDRVKFDTTTKAAADKAAKAAASKESTGEMLSMVRTGVAALLLLLVAFALFRGLRSKSVAVSIPDIGPGSLAAAIAAAQQPVALGAGVAGGVAATGALPAGTHAAVPAAAQAGGEVLQLIDQQPEEVAVLLRSWLADRRS